MRVYCMYLPNSVKVLRNYNCRWSIQNMRFWELRSAAQIVSEIAMGFALVSVLIAAVVEFGEGIQSGQAWVFFWYWAPLFHYL